MYTCSRTCGTSIAPSVSSEGGCVVELDDKDGDEDEDKWEAVVMSG